MPNPLALRDARRTYHFWLDDAVFDTYGPKLGPYAGWVYAYLARRAKSGTAFPSLKRIASDTGMARSSVQTALKRLETLGLITITARANDEGDQDTNVYTLADLHVDQQPTVSPGTGGVPPHGTPMLPHGTPVCREKTYGVPPHGNEGSSLKDPHLEEDTPLPSPVVPLVAQPATRVCEPRTTGILKNFFPEDPDTQAQLRHALLTPELALWATAQGIQLDLEREYTRWLHDGLAHGRKYADFGAAFKSWLTSPYRDITITKGKPDLATRQQEADEAARRFVEEDSCGLTGQTPFSAGSENRMGSLPGSLGRYTPEGLLGGTPR
jgi:hypothetical protein